MIIGVGLDLEEVARFRRVLSLRPGMVEQVFTEEERRIHLASPDPAVGLTAAFAMKEAAFKALGQAWLESHLFWSDIELIDPPTDPIPRIRLSGAAWARGETLGVKRLVTHVEVSPEWVVAQVWLVGDESLGVLL